MNERIVYSRSFPTMFDWQCPPQKHMEREDALLRWNGVSQRSNCSITKWFII
jgi:hypothetical protein